MRRGRSCGGRERHDSITELTSLVDCWDIKMDSAEVMQPLSISWSSLMTGLFKEVYLHARQSLRVMLACWSFVACPSLVTS
jgi:hypothetical protein